jgi:DNA-binding CsgD family transcriptional regulator
VRTAPAVPGLEVHTHLYRSAQVPWQLVSTVQDVLASRGCSDRLWDVLGALDVQLPIELAVFRLEYRLDQLDLDFLLGPLAACLEAHVLRIRDELPRFSFREQILLAGIAQGKTSAEMGRAIFRSASSVDSYIGVMLRRFETSRRIRLIALGYEAGVLPADFDSLAKLMARNYQ